MSNNNNAQPPIFGQQVHDESDDDRLVFPSSAFTADDVVNTHASATQQQLSQPPSVRQSVQAIQQPQPHLTQQPPLGMSRSSSRQSLPTQQQVVQQHVQSSQLQQVQLPQPQLLPLYSHASSTPSLQSFPPSVFNTSFVASTPLNQSFAAQPSITATSAAASTFLAEFNPTASSVSVPQSSQQSYSDMLTSLETAAQAALEMQELRQQVYQLQQVICSK
jgi:hypothetical protein